jgi:outer membrane protein TolC
VHLNKFILPGCLSVFRRLTPFLAIIVISVKVYGQQPGRVYLDSLLKTTVRNYPLIKAKRLQAEGLQYGVKLRQNDIIPSVYGSYQVDYATYNNITGMIYPQYVIPISGPPSKSNIYSGVPGSAAALNLQWQPFTFGQRQSEVELAKSKAQTGRADENLTVFRQQVFVLNAWLDYLLTTDLIKVYQVNIDREAYDLKQSKSVVSSGLRPGTDSSTFHAELARAKIQLLAFEHRRDSVFSVLKELAGGQLPAIPVVDSSLFQNLPVNSSPKETVEHPEIILQKSNVRTDELTLKTYKSTLLPKLTLWGTTYARGSGISADGTVNNGDGWQFERYNYGFGAQLSFPFLEVFRQKPLFKQQQLNIEASREQLNQAQLQLNTQQEIADSALTKAIEAAKLSPEALRAARYSYDAIMSRYQSGLIGYYDVIQSLQLLYQAEASVKVAYWAAWKSLLNKAAYTGSLNVFLNQYGK